MSTECDCIARMLFTKRFSNRGWERANHILLHTTMRAWRRQGEGEHAPTYQLLILRIPPIGNLEGQ